MIEDWRPEIMTPEEVLALSEEERQGDKLIFVSQDMRLKDGVLADSDRLVFQQMQQMRDRGVVRLEEMFPECTEQEGDITLGDYREGLNLDDIIIRQMELTFWVEDNDAAEFIRDIRVEQRGTWRYVAGAASRKYEQYWGENQIIGMTLCDIAAQKFGETYLDEGIWN
jgi:hypothetical protein